MIWLDVTVTLPDKTTIECGEIVVEDSYNNGAFQYTASYLEHPKAFALDPVSLPLSPNEFIAERKEGIFAVFEDALPDDWGRKILIQKANLPRKKQRAVDLLEVLGANGLGALSFMAKGEKVQKNSPAEIVDLPDLLEAALRYDAGLSVTEEQLTMLHIHGSSPGGARPKSVVRKENKSLWIAKFPRESDSFLIEALESGCLKMAQKAGLIVPEFELINVGNRKVLLVKRFDVTNAGGRYHMISMKTLLKAEGYYYLSYNDIFEVLKKYSAQPSIDIPLFFRQMVFNAAIGNTDDHLKNFCMLRKENGFCLSPVYDVLPDVSNKREHTLSFPLGYGGLPPDKAAMQKIGESYKIPQTEEFIESVFLAVFNWKKVFRECNVPEHDIEKLEWSISRRLNALEK